MSRKQFIAFHIHPHWFFSQFSKLLPSEQSLRFDKSIEMRLGKNLIQSKILRGEVSPFENNYYFPAIQPVVQKY